MLHIITRKRKVPAYFAAEAWSHAAAQQFWVVFVEYKNIGIVLYQQVVILVTVVCVFQAVDLSSLDASEDDKIQAMMTQSTQDYNPVQ